MKRKYIFILAIALFVVIAIVVISLAMRSSVTKNTNTQTANSEQVVALPTDIDQRKDTYVEDINDSDQIKNSYGKYVSQDYKKFKYYEADGISDPYAPSDKDANLVPIETFLSSTDANINPKVKSIVGINYYSLFYCINSEKQKEYGTALDIGNRDVAQAQKNYQNAGNYMRQWEPYMLKDLHNILFPSIAMSENNLNQAVTFKDGQYRFAEVDLPDGKSSINYNVTGSPLGLIIITSSQECLKKAIGIYDALD
jgi:hypothetical protein